MPKKTKTETVTKITAATKTKTKAQAKAKTTAIPKSESTIETPKHSQIILEYHRNGNLGFSQVVETVDIPLLTQKKLAGKITTLFHFIRSTSISKDMDSGRTATFMIDRKPLLSLTQKAGNFEKQVFTLTKYKADGAKQSTRKYPYNKAKNLILDAFGFEVKSDVDTDDELSDLLEEGNDSIDNDTELLCDTGFEDDTDNVFDDME